LILNHWSTHGISLIFFAKPVGRSHADIVPLVQKIEAGSIAEIEKMIAEMQDAKNFLQTEWERIHGETAGFMKLAQTASASISLSGRQASWIEL
jgi:hypothetical protein